MYRRRRGVELVLVLIASTIGAVGFFLTHLNRDNTLPPSWPPVIAVWYGGGVALHLVVRWRTPYADPVLLPCVLTLVGVGQAALHRYSLDFPALSPGDFSVTAQLVAVGLGAAICAAVLVGLRDLRRLRSFPLILGTGALALLLLPLTPLGQEINGSRIWIYLGPFSLQPAEIAKLVLAASFAAYLTENRALLAGAGRRIGKIRLTRVRDIGPLLLTWGVSLIILMGERDLGTALLFFGLIVTMLFVATAQVRWLVIAAGLAVAGGLAAWRLFGHVRQRVDYWLRPGDFPQDATQILSAEYGMATGGLAGAGWGLGWPSLTPFYFNDMIAPSLAEEIGLVGLMGLIVIYGVIGCRGLALALRASDGFTKLFACGLSSGFLLQVFAIVGGSTRLLPLTGLTLPFVSQGGSSMLANWLLLALLLVVSHRVRRPPDLVPVDLADERTLTIDVRQLRRLASGTAAPLLDVPSGLVREGQDLTVAVPAPHPQPAEPVPEPPLEPTEPVPAPGLEPATADPDAPPTGPEGRP